MFRVILSVAVLAVAPLACSYAQENDVIEETSADELAAAYEAYAADVLKDVSTEHGEIALDGAPVTLSVPASIDYYDGAESRLILEDLWGNPPDDTVLGMLFPAGESPWAADWGVVITYEDTGYVADEDAKSTDYDALLKEMQKSTRQANSAREREGFATAELVGWAVPPRYDAETHRLEWAKDLLFSTSEGGHTLNYDMRALGRAGVLSLNFVASMEALDSVRAAAPSVLAVPMFNEGSRYTDYREGDKTAGYGVAALISGGVAVAAAKKLGLLGVGLLFLKKGWILVLAAAGGLFGWLRRLFGAGTET